MHTAVFQSAVQEQRSLDNLAIVLDSQYIWIPNLHSFISYLSEIFFFDKKNWWSSLGTLKLDAEKLMYASIFYIEFDQNPETDPT